MSFQFDFSNLSCELLPECTHILSSLFDRHNHGAGETEIQLFPPGFAGVNDESITICFSEPDGMWVHITGIVILTYTHHVPSICALASTAFNEQAVLEIHVNERNQSLAELIQYVQQFIIFHSDKDEANDTLDQPNNAIDLPIFFIEDALDELLLKRNGKPKKALFFLEPNNEV